ncbi:MAG: PqqD family protein [Bacilli bacterium]|nr:PqqD family protein [Bacilli bacterium]
MKIKTGYVLREVGNQCVVVPVGETAVTFNGIITLNKTGKYLWELLQEDVTVDDLVNGMLSKYDVTKEVATKDILEFLEVLRKHQILVE